MQVFVKGTDGKTITLNVDNDDKIIDIKNKYYTKTKSYKPEQQRLIFAGKEMKDLSTLINSNITKESTLHLMYKTNAFEEKLPPKHFYGDSIEDFIINIISSDNKKEQVVVVIPGSKIGSDRQLIEPLVKKDTPFSKYHDTFRQQLPLPILFNAYQKNKDVHIFLFDPAFDINVFDSLDIRAVLDNVDKGINYGGVIDIYISNITDIFKKIEIYPFNYVDKDSLLNLYVIPFSYNQNSLNKLKEKLKSEYYIYLKNPHQPLKDDSFITNSEYKDELIKWHSVEINGGGIPKNYTDKLSTEDKKKQIKAIQKSSKAYQQGKYINRPKLKSFQFKKSPWTKKFEKKFGKNIKSYKQISKVTGIPTGALKAVVKKGMGAYYSSGSRPNQTNKSWGKARMYSYIMGGPARKVDNHITIKYNVDFKG